MKGLPRNTLYLTRLSVANAALAGYKFGCDVTHVGDWWGTSTDEWWAHCRAGDRILVFIIAFEKQHVCFKKMYAKDMRDGHIIGADIPRMGIMG